ncbi:N-formylglutamate amidohydrolase [Brevundimonas sp. LM2]|nr:N-formylglutamate amidohydrolase [Brevundimonas sp. LM2]
MFEAAFPGGEVFDVRWPADGAGRLVFASPHSGGHRPSDMGAIAGLSATTLRSAEDVAVDRLIAVGADHGVPVLSARISRAYLDLNRAPGELDPVLIENVVPHTPSGKVAAGFGVVPRRAGDGTDLYDRRLSLREAEARVAQVHGPYHAALERLMQDARARCGTAMLIDWHSMPSRAAGVPTRGQRGVDIVLGDRHGAACRSGTTRRARALFEAQGWRVGLNVPYAGGYATHHWGRPGDGFEALQVEINRALYLNENTLEPSGDYDRFRVALARVVVALSRELAV